MMNEVYIVMSCNLVDGKRKRESVSVFKDREEAINMAVHNNTSEIWSDCVWHYFIEKRYFYHDGEPYNETKA